MCPLRLSPCVRRVLLTQSRQLNALAMGDESAQSVGVDVRRTRLLLLVIASLLTAVVVSVAGGIGFVGLLVPHAVRLLVGSDHGKLLPATALVGATFLVIVDLAARMLDAPNELPLGIITAWIGCTILPLVTSTRRRCAVMRLSASGIHVVRGGRLVVSGVDLEAPEGRCGRARRTERQWKVLPPAHVVSLDEAAEAES